MRKDEVKIGKVYGVKVSGQVVPVRITEEKWSGDKHVGWVGVNTQTDRPIRIKSAQRLRAKGRGEGESSAKGGPAAATTPGVPESPATPSTAAVAATPAQSPPTATKGKKGGKPGKAPTEKEAKALKAVKPKRVSGLDAAAQVLAGAGRPMNAKDLVAEMATKDLWKSPGGKTPHSTIYAAILREISSKGKDSRFVKADRGMFAAGKGA